MLDRGTESEGIFRLAGNLKRARYLRVLFDKGRQFLLFARPNWDLIICFSFPRYASICTSGCVGKESRSTPLQLF